MSDVFISYARSTASQAQLVADGLRAMGYGVWRDDDLPAHRPYAEVIDERLRAARAVVVIWSADAAKSQWVRAEADLARQAGTLVQLRIDELIPPLPFNQIECADLDGWTGDPQARGWRKVAASVAALVGGEAPEALEVPAPAARASAAVERPRLWGRRRLAWLAVGSAAILIAGLALTLVLHNARPAAVRPVASVRIAGFTALGFGGPTDAPSILTQETRAAFGEDNAVIVTDGKADYALSGTIQRAGDTDRYAVRLNAADGAVIWSGTRDDPVSNAKFAPRQMGIWFAAVVRCGLSGAGQHPTPLPTHVLALYLQACEEGEKDDPSAARGADLSRRIVAEAPAFSRGWSSLAQNLVYSAEDADSPGAAQALRDEAGRAAARAVSLDPRNAEAYRAQAALVTPTALPQAEALLEKAAAANPSDCGCEQEVYGGFLLGVGRVKDALEHLKRGYEQQPNELEAQSAVARAYYLAKQSAEGDAIAAKIEAIGNRGQTALMRLDAGLLQQRWALALSAVDDAAVSADARPGLKAAIAALVSGDRAQMTAAVPELERLSQTSHGSFRYADLLAELGARDAAFTALEQSAVARRRPPVALFHRSMASLRNDPRYLHVLETTGLMRYWRDTKTRPDICADADAPPFCRRL